MPSFCPKCGEYVVASECGKCGEKAVATQINRWKRDTPVAAAGGNGGSAGYVPSAFIAAARLGQSLGRVKQAAASAGEPATALYNFVPQDPSTQIPLTKGDVVEVVRKDSDGWWFVRKGTEKGLVPGSYVRIDNPQRTLPDAAILAAREASNQRFMELSSRSSSSSMVSEDQNRKSVEYTSPLGLESSVAETSPPPADDAGPVRPDARANDGIDRKPKQVRKLRKCFACNETILGRTKVAKEQIFHEICLLCRGCRDPIEEDDEFTIIKKKAYHNDCAKEVIHCRICDKEILGRVYRTAGSVFHKLCMTCSLCSSELDEGTGKLENDALVCDSCCAAREAKIKAEKAAAAAKLAQATAPQDLARNRKNSVLESMHDGKRDLPPPAPVEEEEKAVEEVNRKFSVTSVSSGLGDFDLKSSAPQPDIHERLSDMSELESEADHDNDYGGNLLNSERESLRLSQVLDLGTIESFESTGRQTHDRLSAMSDLSGISEDDGDASNAHPEAVEEGDEEFLSDEEDRELCGGCGLVLEGEAIGALEKFFHYECFKCSHCQKVIAEDDGYAEKDGMAFHQGCYQVRFGKKCCRCKQVLKGKVVKALDQLYHPDCFVCFTCSSSLSESFFEHQGQAICAKCKHNTIMEETAQAQAKLKPIGSATAGYQFVAQVSDRNVFASGTINDLCAFQDETQLTINPGDNLAILQKDDDGWWLVELRNQRGYVPGSYLVEHPKNVEPPKEPTPPPSPAKEAPPPGLCSECGTKNPDVARFCRSCGNRLQIVLVFFSERIMVILRALRRYVQPALRQQAAAYSRKSGMMSVWDRVRPSFWHPMATLEQSMMEMDRMANQLLSSASFPFSSTHLMPRMGEDDEFFKDLPVKSPKEAPKQGHSKEKATTEASKPQQSYSSYMYSSSTVYDENGHRVSTVRRRYEDSAGRLKAVHEREIDDKKVKSIWHRKSKDDEGEHHTKAKDCSVEEFEEEWQMTPFGKAEDEQRQVGGDQKANATKSQDNPEDGEESQPDIEVPKNYTFGSDPEAAKKAPPKEPSTAAHGVTEEAKSRSRQEANAQGSKNQAEETTPPQYG
ncbi:TPA: hypothetical protein N0F65_005185 [Lagenidium giganteum]|uniref:Uncharacterized protein n=1 Tax=Lagenidium giganteum TaxID=4803 RepID=A0AAV2Z152_9STRA|nr:TPA: hypothetical protein N0F65_005185 [Lagenidium giganteum]